MRERRFFICEAPSPTEWIFKATSIPESEFHRRIDRAFRAAFCVLTEKFDYEKAVDILIGKEVEHE